MKGYRNTHGHPGRIIVVRDELWQRHNGNINMIQPPPPLSGEMVQFLQILLSEHDRLSGNQDALQGAGKSMWSGKTVETLAAAARGPIGFKGNYLEFMVQRMVDLMIDKMMREAEFGTVGEHNDVLATYKMFAYDEGWSRRIIEAIDSGLTAEAAIERVQQRTRMRMRQIDDPLLADRMHDLEDLANRLLEARPRQKITFESGYTVDDISTDFLTRHNHARFLQKPYTRVTLARTVRDALDGAAGSQKTGRAISTRVTA